jgi:hypothetical protein
MKQRHKTSTTLRWEPAISIVPQEDTFALNTKGDGGSAF